MSVYIKVVTTVTLFVLWASAIGADRFVVKYKPNNEAEEQIREEQMKPLSKEQLDALSKAANIGRNQGSDKIQVTDTHFLATGSHVVTLSKDLDEAQTEQFINNVKQDRSILYIGEEIEFEACFDDAV